MTEPKCEHCWKVQSKCLCAEVSPVEHRLQFILLQHPQEAKKAEGTARLVSLSMPQMVHRVGLSWPSLKRLLGREVNADRWAVLYAGSLKELSKLGDEPYLFSSKKVKTVEVLEGVVVLDGNWKQAKTLWWRNPWLKKLNRLILNPKEPSRYATVRKQPRRNCLSTLESVATVLRQLERNEKGARQLEALFEKHVALF